MWQRLNEDAESHLDTIEPVEPREPCSSPESRCVTGFGGTWGCRRYLKE